MRVFAFGCSLTQYFYPTWADILITHYEDTHEAPGMNWGRSGAGNMYISTRIWEANAVHKFTKDDIILIQWSNMFREDRYHEDNGWYCPGGFGDRNYRKVEFELNGFKYEDEMQWTDQLHCVMRDCALISSTKTALKHIGCTVVDTGFRDWKEGLLSEPFEKETLLTYENQGTIIDTYGDIVTPAVTPILNALNFETSNEFFNTRPLSVPADDNELAMKTHLLPEIHPLPLEHLDFVERFVCPVLGIEKLHDNAYELANKYNDKIKDKDVIILRDLAWANLEQTGFSDDGWRP
mgnify:CR=1 FL=1